MKKFNTSIPGYNKNEVNSFVQNVTNEYESMLNNLKARDAEIEKLKQELEHYKTIENTLNRAILIAEESTHNIKKSAITEAKVIVEDAKKNASRIINNALIKSEELEKMAQSLKRRVSTYKRKYKDYLETELETVETLNLDTLEDFSKFDN